jgi:uncharacterized membrane protein
MDEYVVVKWIHILSSTVLFGTGIGSAYYMLVASRNRDPRIAHFVVSRVVIADWIFTATAAVLQPLSGAYLVYLGGYSVTSRWIVGSVVLFLVAGACWLPVVWMQIRMREMARQAAEAGRPLPDSYGRLFRLWVALGLPAFAALVVVFYLMVAKPN